MYNKLSGALRAVSDSYGNSLVVKAYSGNLGTQKPTKPLAEYAKNYNEKASESMLNKAWSAGLYQDYTKQENTKSLAERYTEARDSSPVSRALSGMTQETKENPSNSLKTVAEAYVKVRDNSPVSRALSGMTQKTNTERKLAQKLKELVEKGSEAYVNALDNCQTVNNWCGRVDMENEHKREALLNTI